jgi:WD40 repeat protein
VPACLAFEKGSRNRQFYSENAQYETTRAIRAMVRSRAILFLCTEPEKIYQKELNWRLLTAKNSAKQPAELKTPILSQGVGRAGRRGGLGISTKGLCWIFYNGGGAPTVGLWASADDVMTKRIEASGRNRATRRTLRAIALAAAVFTATSIATVETRAEDSPASSGTAASAQQPLPELRYVRTLPAPNEIYSFGMFQSGTSGLTWSPDGERLAAYIRSGLAIMAWSPDGKYQYEFPRHGFGPTAYALGFLSGHSQIITSPAAQSNTPDEQQAAEQNAFSVIDPATGKVLQGVPGPNPGKTFRENEAHHLAISPDRQLAAVIYHPYAGRSIGVYSTRDWLRVAVIDLDDDRGMGAQALAFSPDSTKLAIAHGRKGRVDILGVGSWTLLRTIEAFPEQPPAMQSVFLRALAFSPDASMIAVGSGSGGVYWQYRDGSPAPEGEGNPIRQFPYDPLRVFRVDDGSFVASAAEFAASFDDNRLAWSPASGFLAFVDSYRQLRLWSPAHPGPPTIAVKPERNMGGLAFSPDGGQLAVNFLNGVKIFDVIGRHGNEPQQRKSR